MVDRRAVGEDRGRDVRDNDAVLAHHHAARVRDGSDMGGVEVPFGEDLLDLALAPLLHDDEHPLLGLGKHDLVGIHPLLALGNPVEFDLDARPAPARGLAG